MYQYSKPKELTHFLFACDYVSLSKSIGSGTEDLVF